MSCCQSTVLAGQVGADTAATDPYKRSGVGTPPKSRGDYAFISHMVEAMNSQDGRVGVVVPHGVLFRGGSEGLIRQRFIEENLLEGVIGLPANLFYGVGIPAALMFFNRKKKDKKVFFIDASREYAEGKNQNRLRKRTSIRSSRRGVAQERRQSHTCQASMSQGKRSISIFAFVDTLKKKRPRSKLVAAKFHQLNLNWFDPRDQQSLKGGGGGFLWRNWKTRGGLGRSFRRRQLSKHYIADTPANLRVAN